MRKVERVSVQTMLENQAIGKVIEVLEPVLMLGILAIATGYLVDGSFNPFLYFRF